MDDFDIYADLPNFNVNEIDNQEKNTKNFEEKNKILEKEIRLLKTKLEKLEDINNKLKHNFSSLIKTAKAEISRKDRTIKDLRTKLDDFVFRRNQYKRNKMQIKNNHYINYPPPPVNTEFTDDVKPNTDYYSNYPPLPVNTEFTNEVQQSENVNDLYIKIEPHPIMEEFTQIEKIEFDKQQNVSDVECDDAVTNKSEYRSTVYGDRLRKKLLQEIEDEKKEKEEKKKEKKEEKKEKKDEKREKDDEFSQKNECFDKVNNKENLATINEVAQSIDSNINSDKTLDSMSNSTNFIKTEITLIKKNDYLELKEDQIVNNKSDNLKTNKYFDTNNSSIDTVRKNFSNTCNDSLIHKNYKNRDHNNYKDRHRFNEVFYIKPNDRYSRQDKYKNLFETYNRHRSSHRYKSRDRERSSSGSGTKDDYRKRYIKLEDKYDHTSKKFKSYKKDKEDKHNHIPNEIKLHKKDKEDHKRTQSTERSKKHRKDKIKSPKRRRRSESEELISHKIKRIKTSTENSIEITSFNKILSEETKSDSFKIKERRKLKPDIEKSEKGSKEVKDTAKLNKITEEIIVKRKESIPEKDRKKIIIQDYNEKLINNVECTKDSAKSNRNKVNETKNYNFIQKQETNTSNSSEKVMSNISCITNVNKTNEKCTDNIEKLLEELEEGEIIDSPKHELESDYVYNHDDESKINDDTCTKTNILKNFEIQKKDEIKENLSTCKMSKSDLCSTKEQNCESLKVKASIDISIDKHTSSTKPKKDEDEDSKLLYTILAQDSPEKSNNSINVCTKIEESTVGKSKLNTKSVEHESKVEKHTEVSVNDTKFVKEYNDRINNMVPKLHIQENDDEKDDNALNLMDKTKILKDKNIKLYFSEINTKNVSNTEEHKNNKRNDKDSGIEINQNSTDKVLQKNKKQETNSSNNLNKQVLKPSNHTEAPLVNKEKDNGLNKKVTSVFKPETAKNIIVIRHRRRPVKLSDSQPALVISPSTPNKST